MGVANVKRDLPSNRMIFDVRRNPEQFTNFPDKLERLMEEYGLSEVEREAFRHIDINKLGELGVHPYFLPQISRLFHGGAYNHNNSVAAQAYGKSVVEGKGKLR